ncbi:MAG: hypothetical protein KC657_25525 [Myxococcales bacterium]|nr:hypothetical protein [Myxococcales bacterium]
MRDEAATVRTDQLAERPLIASARGIEQLCVRAHGLTVRLFAWAVNSLILRRFLYEPRAEKKKGRRDR